MIRLWTRWVKLIDRREGGEAMAALRLSMGAAAVYATLHNYSVAHLVWVDAAHGGYRNLPPTTGMVEWLGGATPDVISGLLAVTLTCALLLFFGVLPRAAALRVAQAVLLIAAPR